ncbi:amidohydrolase family protein [Actinacidiphila sp. bgisy144]|uniref:metal-dependent hydrolase family protein n=1 Tax=unclassified Actinacidiphila TaxID=2995708 RepID=UPI003EBD2FB4
MNDKTWTLRNVAVIDGTGAPREVNQALVVDDGRVAWRGPAELAPPFERGRVIEGAGMTLVPGLVNSHVHLVGACTGDLAQQVASDSTTLSAVRAARNAADTLECGITAVRDCGARDGVVVELARAVAAGLTPGPRIVPAGRVITMTGGHGHFMGREADGADAVCRSVRREIKDGAHFIKIMSTGGIVTPGVDPGQTGLGLDELQAATRAAHAAGKRVAAHAIGREGIKNALLAGVDSIEHGFWLDEELFDIAGERGVFLVPTLLAVRSIVEHGPLGGAPGWMLDKAGAVSERVSDMFASAVRAGMNISAGTDAGTPFNPHTDLVRELTLMVQIGLSPMDALMSATSRAATNLGIDDITGTVEVGKQADLVLVGSDPLQDISVLRSPQLVSIGGRFAVDRVSQRHREPVAC